ncbi:hypothetical protein EV193_11481 [Herbihabitans rhizosphaerae]|uniref:Uncharacterized protein n=1 Tax=Herbihabitans rhizosphaerae TaxID=1872711 RepID=A0A4Q7KEV1_9PSEU|nr:DUF6578 domain-containing protein [Herbihabitans rhizosphaerae]RZS31390.1 hypothetical protein EV193_11481 [Herbihabitans rhizosphaerae]
MSTVSVMVEDWQYDCCGEAFAVGDTVTWRLHDAAWWVELFADDAPSGLLTQEHHSGVPDHPPTTTGVVRRIRQVAFRTRQEDRVIHRIPGTATFLETDSPTTHSMEGRHAGWLVDLEISPPE